MSTAKVYWVPYLLLSNMNRIERLPQQFPSAQKAIEAAEQAASLRADVLSFGAKRS